jgi:hypothetical protein
VLYATVRLGIRCRYWVLSHTYNCTILYSIEAAYIYIYHVYHCISINVLYKQISYLDVSRV